MTEIDTEQERWNEYGRRQLASIAAHPERHQIDPNVFPMPYRLDDRQVADLHALLGDIKGKRVLEVGCGYGRFTTYLAKHGAEVTSIDLGFDLVTSTRALAKVNGVEVQVAQADISHLPFAPGSFDIVIGLAVLHHLSEPNVEVAIADGRRVLREPGVAVYYETIEDSRVFNVLQQTLPAGKPGDDQYRPSSLNRRAWKEFIRDLDEREMTSDEFLRGGRNYSATRLHRYGLVSRLERLKPFQRLKPQLASVDRWLLGRIRPLERLARYVLVEYRT